MKSLFLPLAALVSLASTQAEAGYWKRFFKPARATYVIDAPVVYQPVAPCYSCHTHYAPVYRPAVYQPVYQPVVYRPARPHVGFSFGTHGAGFSFWS